jgi:hypothetical protein
VKVRRVRLLDGRSCCARCAACLERPATDEEARAFATDMDVGWSVNARTGQDWHVLQPPTDRHRDFSNLVCRWNLDGVSVFRLDGVEVDDGAGGTVYVCSNCVAGADRVHAA